jgi:LysM repeat protein
MSQADRKAMLRVFVLEKASMSLYSNRWTWAKRSFWLAIWIFSLAMPARADGLPAEAYIRGVIGHAQRFSLSCESRSAVDWAAFWGVKIGEAKFLNKLPRSDNPDFGFVGNPDGTWGSVPPYSYGVHAEPVAALLRNYGLQAEARKGLDWDDLRSEIAAGRPAIVWVIGQMWPGSPRRYIDAQGRATKVAPFEHSMILIGYSSSTVNVIDAYSGLEQVYPQKAFLTSWAALGNMAVIGTGGPPPAPAETQKQATTYSVKSDDLLIDLAHQFNVPWQELAALNGLTFPYLLQEGQILQLPVTATADLEEPVVSSGVFQMPENISPLHLPVPVGPVLMYQFYLALVAKQPTAVPPQAEQQLPDDSQSTSPTPGTPLNPVETYTVRNGDYLKSLAQQFGMDWQHIADLNGIQPPYTIYPGQLLKLR